MEGLIDHAESDCFNQNSVQCKKSHGKPDQSVLQHWLLSICLIAFLESVQIQFRHQFIIDDGQKFCQLLHNLQEKNVP
jgi:hypothetical protein